MPRVQLLYAEKTRAYVRQQQKTMTLIIPDWISATHMGYRCSVCAGVHVHQSNADFTPRDELRVSHCLREQCTHVLRITACIPRQARIPARRRPKRVAIQHPNSIHTHDDVLQHMALCSLSLFWCVCVCAYCCCCYRLMLVAWPP